MPPSQHGCGYLHEKLPVDDVFGATSLSFRSDSKKLHSPSASFQIEFATHWIRSTSPWLGLRIPKYSVHLSSVQLYSSSEAFPLLSAWFRSKFSVPCFEFLEKPAPYNTITAPPTEIDVPVLAPFDCLRFVVECPFVHTDFRSNTLTTTNKSAVVIVPETWTNPTCRTCQRVVILAQRQSLETFYRHLRSVPLGTDSHKSACVRNSLASQPLSYSRLPAFLLLQHCSGFEVRAEFGRQMLATRIHIHFSKSAAL